MSRDKRPPAVALFVYNRPRQLERTLECLRAAKPGLVYVFSDGPRSETDRDSVAEVRDMVGRINWVQVEHVARPANLGLSESIRQGLDRVFSENERAVIVEDDIFVSPGFLDYMGECLDRYSGALEVAGVTGLRYPFSRDCFEGYEHDGFFAPRFSSWGWGTWRRFWTSVDFDPASLTHKLRTGKADLGRAGADIMGMANALAAGTLHGGWDVFCCLNVLLNGQVFAWPTWNQIENGGLVEGTHAGREMPRWRLRWERPGRRRANGLRLPEAVETNPAIMTEFLRFFANSVRPNRAPGFRLPRLRSVRTLLGKAAARFLPPRTPRDPKAYSTVPGAGTYVPCQVEAYFLALNRYVDEGATVLDVGFGLGYGLNILAIKAKSVSGVDVDKQAYEYCRGTVEGRNPRLASIGTYDGYNLPFSDGEFDVLTCIDVIEHVDDYDRLIREMLRVSRKGVFLSTPNRRPEYTNADGTPKNQWHLREWSFEEFDRIARRHGRVEWNFLNGPFEGPFTVSGDLQGDTLALSPFIFK
jgi:SAM-dependent methyltransferase